MVYTLTCKDKAGLTFIYHKWSLKSESDVIDLIYEKYGWEVLEITSQSWASFLYKRIFGRVGPTTSVPIDSRITNYKNNGLLPTNYVAPTLSTVDAGAVVKFSPASLSWVSEDVAAAQASAWREQFTEFYDISLEDWIASGNDALFASLNGLKFLGLVENGKITDAAINAAEAAEISSNTMWWYCSEFNSIDLSDVKYWPSNVSADFSYCTFGDSVPTSGDSEIYDCNFGSVLPVGRIYGGVIPEGAVAQEGTRFCMDLPNTIANLTNPEVATCSYVDFNYGPTLTVEQIAAFGSLSDCTLPNNTSLTYAQATTLGILARRQRMLFEIFGVASDIAARRRLVADNSRRIPNHPHIAPKRRQKVDVEVRPIDTG